MKITSLIASASALVLLTGCAGAVPWNPQGYSGVNMVEAEFVVADGQSGPKSIKVVGGK
jgi:hypothetical protein